MPLPKNIRNYKAYLEKKKRGPVKTFFHITKNENVPAIEKKGLLANHPNANINSAFQPFRKHGSTGGGVWVTTEPTAFPVYGTTIGGRSGDASARADALSTFKIDIPKAELPKMLAVQDPYGKNILRKGNDPKAIEPFYTWYGIDVPTTAFLNDMKPAWLKNLGYVEERSPIHPILDTRPDINELKGSWGISPDAEDAGSLRQLSKGDLRDYSGLTGHGHGFGTYDKSPQRFVEDYLNRSRPITYRLPIFPKPFETKKMARIQGAENGPNYFKTIPFKIFKKIRAAGAPDLALDLMGRNRPKRYSADFIPANHWAKMYRDYIKPGESILDRRKYKFKPGAVSRGMGGRGLPPLKDRLFNWDTYAQEIEASGSPRYATYYAQPVKLDWDNIQYDRSDGYGPRIKPNVRFLALSEGPVSRGAMTVENIMAAEHDRVQRQAAAQLIRLKRAKLSQYLSRKLGRPPTTEELDALARADISNDIKAGDIPNVPPVLRAWADKVDWDMADRISEEIIKRMGK